MLYENVLRRALLAFVFGIGGVTIGCASQGSSGSPTTTPSPAETTVTAPGTSAAAHRSAHSECLVCKYNADLACIDIPVDKTTPSYTYNGKTYYFCSDECRDKFKKDPQKYVAQK